MWQPAAGDGDLSEDLLRTLLDNYVAFTGAPGEAVRTAALAILNGYDEASAAAYVNALKASASRPKAQDAELEGDLCGLSGEPKDM